MVLTMVLALLWVAGDDIQPSIILVLFIIDFYLLVGELSIVVPVVA